MIKQLLIGASKTIGEVQAFRARTDDRHIAPEHIPQLRQLVELATRQERPDRCHPRVIFGSKGRSTGTDIRTKFSELVHSERLSPPTHSSLREEYRSTTLYQDGDSD